MSREPAQNSDETSTEDAAEARRLAPGLKYDEHAREARHRGNPPIAAHLLAKDQGRADGSEQRRGEVQRRRLGQGSTLNE
ncbi:MAG: hypothetical protein M5U09_27645 [Gammaproteobacteria bacterium]|nr:hypothetical protein [Gammaproteobacteria bacterium]